MCRLNTYLTNLYRKYIYMCISILTECKIGSWFRDLSINTWTPSAFRWTPINVWEPTPAERDKPTDGRLCPVISTVLLKTTSATPYLLPSNIPNTVNVSLLLARIIRFQLWPMASTSCVCKKSELNWYWMLLRLWWSW